MLWILDSRRTGSALTSVCELLNDDHISNSVSITGEAAEMLATSDATQILQNALHVSTIAVNMQCISGQSPTFDYRFIPFMSSVSNVLLSQHTNSYNKQITQEDSYKILDNVLQGWGMNRHEIAGDGNCCFSAIAFFLIYNRISIIEYKADYFTSHGFGDTLEVPNMAEKLRNLAVQGWRDN